MAKVSCHYCGIPFRVTRVEENREYFCCTGCAMLSHVPVDEKGQFPVNAHLVSALAAGFLLFNQLLFWLVAELLVRESRMVLAERFFWLSGAAALLVWLCLAVLHGKERAWKALDIVCMAAGLIVLAAACRRLPPHSFEMACSSVAVIAISFRGLFRRLLRSQKNAA
jgi:hypothetical protein